MRYIPRGHLKGEIIVSSDPVNLNQFVYYRNMGPTKLAKIHGRLIPTRSIRFVHRLQNILITTSTDLEIRFALSPHVWSFRATCDGLSQGHRKVLLLLVWPTIKDGIS